MTDNEIIKALEICSHRNGDLPCEGCPAYSIAQMCMEDLMSDAFDLINRQKAELEELKEDYIPKLEGSLKRANEIGMSQDAEIERLKAENKILSKNADTAFQDGLNEAQDLYAAQIQDKIKSEARQEFAERLKEKLQWDVEFDNKLVFESDIDNLVKEIADENENV